MENTPIRANINLHQFYPQPVDVDLFQGSWLLLQFFPPIKT